MAKTAEKKTEIAQRIYDLVVGGYKMKPHDLIFDTLTFTQGKSNWGYAFRFGLLKVTETDMDAIMLAMNAKVTLHASR